MENVQNLIAYYEQTKTIMAAIAARKGGIDADSYVGRFYAADVLEMIVEMGGAAAQPLHAEFESLRALTTPSKKPIHKMTLEEFEKVMNI